MKKIEELKTIRKIVGKENFRLFLFWNIVGIIINLPFTILKILVVVPLRVISFLLGRIFMGLCAVFVAIEEVCRCIWEMDNLINENKFTSEATKEKFREMHKQVRKYHFENMHRATIKK